MFEKSNLSNIKIPYSPGLNSVPVPNLQRYALGLFPNPPTGTPLVYVGSITPTQFPLSSIKIALLGAGVARVYPSNPSV